MKWTYLSDIFEWAPLDCWQGKQRLEPAWHRLQTTTSAIIKLCWGEGNKLILNGTPPSNDQNYPSIWRLIQSEKSIIFPDIRIIRGSKSTASDIQ